MTVREALAKLQMVANLDAQLLMVPTTPNDMTTCVVDQITDDSLFTDGHEGVVWLSSPAARKERFWQRRKV